MLRIALCDDEAGVRLALRLNLEGVLNRMDQPYQFYEFSSGEGAVGWFDKHPGEVDVLFLDIEMGGISGMETARALRAGGYKAALVFVTGYADYVFDGYEVDALGYLLKPVKTPLLEKTLRRVLAKIQVQSGQTYTLHNTGGVYRVFYEDILYFYSDKRRVSLVTAAREYSFYAKLDEVQAEVGQAFVRTHQRFLARAGAITALRDNRVFLGTLALPVSRAMKPAVAAALAEATLAGGAP